MRTQKRRPLTPAQREARRRNGQKSKGPRTPMGKKIVSMNAVKHGMYSNPSIESMAVLQENPLEYVKLLAGLIGSFHPRNAAETILIEDIAHLQWQRRRNEVARGARIALAVQRLELERAELRRTTEKGASLDASEEEVKQKGLRGIAHSPAKYRDMLSVLSILTDLAKKKQFGKATHYLNLLYGEAKQEARTRGNMIRTFFEQLELGAAAAGAEPNPSAAETGDPTPASEFRERQRALLEMLNEEYEEVGEHWHNYSMQHVEITPALRGSLYAPGPEDWPLLREQALVDGLLVRKYKLLLEMQRARRRAAAEEGEVEWDFSSLDLKEPEPEGGVSPAPGRVGGAGAQAVAPGGGPPPEARRPSEALTTEDSAAQGGLATSPKGSVDHFRARPAAPDDLVERGEPQSDLRPPVHHGDVLAKMVEHKKANGKRKKSRLTPVSRPGRRCAPRFFLREQSYRSRSKQTIGVRRIGKQTYRFHTKPSAGLCPSAGDQRFPKSSPQASLGVRRPAPQPALHGTRRLDAAFAQPDASPPGGSCKRYMIPRHENQGGLGPAGRKMNDWPHSPVHRLAQARAYMVTCGTYLKRHHFQSPERLRLLCEALQRLAAQYSWNLQAWAVFSNHYHWVGLSPHDPTTPRTFISELHTKTSTALNEATALREGRSGFSTGRHGSLVDGRILRVELRPLQRGASPAGSRTVTLPVVFRRMVRAEGETRPSTRPS